MREIADFKKLEKLIKSVANRRRLAIISFLKKEGEASVGDIAKHLQLSFKSTSKHIAVLFAADLLEREQRSSEMFYGFAPRQHVLIERLHTLL